MGISKTGLEISVLVFADFPLFKFFSSVSAIFSACTVCECVRGRRQRSNTAAS